MKPFLSKLLKYNFPANEHICHAFGYGSAVFKQANYNIEAADQVIDLLLVVDSAKEFHEKNFSHNYGHYSGLPKRLPLGFTSEFVQRKGSKIYFNPLIPFKSFKCTYGEPDESSKEFYNLLQDDKRKLKYGIIQKDDAIEDLLEWKRFALAGRMQKPILNIFEDPEVQRAQETNRDNALNLALLLSYHEVEPVDVFNLYFKLCNFSYKGDIRMRWKMENPDKVGNIVQGSFQGLQDIYAPRLLEYQNQGILKIVETNEDGSPKLVRLVHSTAILQQLFDQVPSVLKWRMKESVLALSLRELQGDLDKHLAGIVDVTSIHMIFGGMYSTNPLKKGLPYLYSKFQKGRKK